MKVPCPLQRIEKFASHPVVGTGVLNGSQRNLKSIRGSMDEDQSLCFDQERRQNCSDFVGVINPCSSKTTAQPLSPLR